MRVAPNFTLNLGLRYEFATTYEENNGDGYAVRNLATDASATPGTPFENNSLKNFGPRFGFAWDVTGDGKTAVRGGFAELFDIGNLGSALVVGVTATPPLSSSSSVATPATLTLPLYFPPSAAGRSLRTVDYNIPQPHMLQYNFTVERQLPSNMALTVAYAGSRGINLIRTVEGNPTIPEILPAGQEYWNGSNPRINRNWGTVELATGGGNSWYNALQMGLTKRLSKGLQLQSSFTWSKLIDQTQGQFGSDVSTESVFGSDPLDRKTDQGLSAYDIPRVWRTNAIYQLPTLVSSGGALGKLLNGWWMSGVLSLQDGYPFSVVEGTNRSLSQVNGGGAGIDRPNLVLGRSNSNITSGVSSGCVIAPSAAFPTGVIPAGTPLGTPTLYYDPCAFTIQPVGFLGNAGRGILLSPGLANLDFSLDKDTPLRLLGENGKLEFRAEVFNITNRPNFSTPSRTVFSPTATQSTAPAVANAGEILSTGTNKSRQIQVALKIIF